MSSSWRLVGRAWMLPPCCHLFRSHKPPAIHSAPAVSSLLKGDSTQKTPQSTLSAHTACPNQHFISEWIHRPPAGATAGCSWWTWPDGSSASGAHCCAPSCRSRRARQTCWAGCGGAMTGAPGWQGEQGSAAEGGMWVCLVVASTMARCPAEWQTISAPNYPPTHT